MHIKKSTAGYIRHKVIYFSVFLITGIFFFAFHPADAAHQNAAVICLLDDMSNSYKTQVFYTGKNIELGRISQVLPGSVLITDGAEDRIPLLNFCTTSHDGEYADAETGFPYFKTVVSSSVPGEVSVYYTPSSGQDIPISSINASHDSEFWQEIEDMNFSFDSSGDGSYITTPLTFPADLTLDATAADINRAYTIADTLGDDFNNALSFINGGKAFTSVDQLISTAYGLCIIESGGTYTNSQGLSYKVRYLTDPDDPNGYSYKCNIQDSSYNTNNYSEELYNPSYENQQEITKTLSTKSGSFVWKMKKGYKDSSVGQTMEDGVRNQIANRYSSSYEDTTYVTWQHLFLQAGILYSEGITYANQSDIYTIEGMESSITDFFRKILDGVSGFVNLYSMEELIFNKGVRGTQAFYMGTFNRNFESYLLNMFLIFAAISVSLVFFVIVRIILKRQLATANRNERASFLESVKDLLISLFFMAFSWGAIKLVLILNYQFVDIFSTLVGGKTLQRITAGGVVIGGIIVQFTYFILELYVNYVYIIRGLVIASLMIVAPLFIMALNFGQKGRAMFEAWLRELLGSVFLQSLHALVYGIIIVASVGSRGIEGIVMIGAIIPLTSMFKELTGSGGDTILQTAAGLTRTTAETMGNTAQLAGSTAGAMFQGTGSIIGGALEGGIAGPVGEIAGNAAGNLGKMASGLAEAAGGAINAGLGEGLDVSTIGGGSGMKRAGTSQMGKGISKSVLSFSEGAGNAAGKALGRTDEEEEENKEFEKAVRRDEYVERARNSRHATQKEARRFERDTYSYEPGDDDFMDDMDHVEDAGGHFRKERPRRSHEEQEARRTALDHLHSNSHLRAMKQSRISPPIGDDMIREKDGMKAVEQSYHIPSDMPMKKMSRSDRKVYKAIQDYNADMAAGTMNHFNKKYGSDYARLEKRIMDGEEQSVLTFGRYMDESISARARNEGSSGTGDNTASTPPDTAPVRKTPSHKDPGPAKPDD